MKTPTSIFLKWRSLALAAALAALSAGRALAGESQTFWTLSTGPVPSPYPTPSTYPVEWYGALYYPIYWPVCVHPGDRRCRPPHAHVWPPAVPPGKHPVPAPPR